MEISDSGSVPGIGLASSVECLFKFDEELDNPHFFAKRTPRSFDKTDDIRLLDDKTFLSSPNLFFQ